MDNGIVVKRQKNFGIKKRLLLNTITVVSKLKNTFNAVWEFS